MKNMLTEVLLEDNNARWGNQMCSYRKAMEFGGVKHLGSNKPESHGSQ